MEDDAFMKDPGRHTRTNTNSFTHSLNYDDDDDITNWRGTVERTQNTTHYTTHSCVFITKREETLAGERCTEKDDTK